MSDTMAAGAKEELIPLLQGSLRVESITHGYTMLNDENCPDHFIAQRVFSINQIVGGNLTIEMRDGRCFDVSDGSAILLPDGELHRFTNNNPGKTYSAWNTVQYTIMETIDPVMLLDMPRVIGGPPGRKVGAINGQLTALDPLQYENPLEYLVKCHSLGMQLLEIVLSVSELRTDAYERLVRTDRIQPVLRYIKRNISRSIHTDDMASVLNLSVPRFFEVFRETAGMSPGRYIQQQRMKKAQELLVNTDLRIYEVAEAVGYGDPFHFSRVFKRNFKVSPERFRRQWR